MIKLENYIIEFHKCLYPVGYVIEISKKEEIDEIVKIKKEYLFYNLINGTNKAKVKMFILGHSTDEKLKSLLKNSTI